MSYSIEYTYPCKNNKVDMCPVEVANEMYGITVDNVSTRDKTKYLVFLAEDYDCAEDLIEMIGGTCKKWPSSYTYNDSSRR
tara:strand:+ start:2533 stop:2775 length:243 start_codon:yes stop_codon:yes gene_type:complete